MSKLLLTLLPVFLITGSLSYAQNNEAVADTLELDNITITASKIPQTERQTTKNVILIGREEIEKNQGKDLSQLLNIQNGVVVNNALSNRSSNQSVYLQGADNDFTLILLDGVPINDPSGPGGAFDLRLIPLDNIERIEIVKGSQSTLYGSNAIAGVINIITKENSTNPYTFNGGLSYGSFNTLNANIGISGVGEGIGYVLNYAYEGSDGISEAENNGNPNRFDNDGINSNSFLGKFDFPISKNLNFITSLSYSFFEGEFDGGSFTDARDSFYELEFYNPSAQLKYSGDQLSFNALYNYTESRRLFNDPFFGVTEIDGQFHNADVYGSYQLIDQVNVLGGVNYQDLIADDFNSQIISPYINAFVTGIAGFSAEAGLRLNDHSEFGSNVNYNVSPAYTIVLDEGVLDELKVFASASTGFKAPSLSELFGPFGSNPDLDPEESSYVDAGFRANFGGYKFQFDGSYFQRNVDNLITFSANTFALVNALEQRDRGFEFGTRYRPTDKVSIRGFYNFLDGELRFPEFNISQDNLLRRPRHRFGFQLDLIPVENLNINAQWLIVGDRDDVIFLPPTFAAEEVILANYSILNVYVEYAIPEAGITFFSDFGNVYDTDFNQAGGFSAAGITFKSGVRLSLSDL